MGEGGGEGERREEEERRRKGEEGAGEGLRREIREKRQGSEWFYMSPSLKANTMVLIIAVSGRAWLVFEL